MNTLPLPKFSFHKNHLIRAVCAQIGTPENVGISLLCESLTGAKRRAEWETPDSPLREK